MAETEQYFSSLSSMACFTACSSKFPRKRYRTSRLVQTAAGSPARSPEQITSSDCSFTRYFCEIITTSVAVHAPSAIRRSSIGPGASFVWRSESMAMACPEGLVATNLCSPIHFTLAVCMGLPRKRHHSAPSMFREGAGMLGRSLPEKADVSEQFVANAGKVLPHLRMSFVVPGNRQQCRRSVGDEEDRVKTFRVVLRLAAEALGQLSQKPGPQGPRPPRMKDLGPGAPEQIVFVRIFLGEGHVPPIYVLEARSGKAIFVHLGLEALRQGHLQFVLAAKALVHGRRGGSRSAGHGPQGKPVFPVAGPQAFRGPENSLLQTAVGFRRHRVSPVYCTAYKTYHKAVPWESVIDVTKRYGIAGRRDTSFA